MAESMLAELAILESQMEREQASLKRIVFGAVSADEPPVPDQPSSSQIIRLGSQWTGTLGCSPYHLVFCWRDESWLEAVGIYPGIGASRIEGDISFSPVRAVPQPRSERGWCSDLPNAARQDGRAVQITLKEVERLAGSWQQPSPSYQLELELLGHKLHGQRGEVRPALAPCPSALPEVAWARPASPRYDPLRGLSYPRAACLAGARAAALPYHLFRLN